MHIDRRLLGWGLFFIIAGAIPLAARFGALDPALVRGWFSLWPLLLVGWGIGLLLRRTPIEWLGGAVVAVVFGVMAGGLLATGFGGVPAGTGCTNDAAGTTFASRSGSIERDGRISVDLNCGSLTMRAASGDTWTLSGTESKGRAPDVRADNRSVSIEGPDRQ